MNDAAWAPIGVFDSGIGGLTVVRSLLEHLPHERFIYLGDTARVPYGGRSPQTILRYTQDAVAFLQKHNVKMLVIACNTASAAAEQTLKASLKIPVLGVIGPSAAAACRASLEGEIGVLATRATVKMGAYEKAIKELQPLANTYSQACPLFVPLVEEGWSDKNDEVASLVAKRYLLALQAKAPEIDTLVLGCTHYPLIAATIEMEAKSIFKKPIKIVSSGDAMAKAVELSLRTNQLSITRADNTSEKRLTCYVTDEAQVLEIGSQFLGQHLEKVQVVEL